MHVTDEFLEFISDGALAIEVWGHRCAGNGHSLWELDALEAKTQTLRDRYMYHMFHSHFCTYTHTPEHVSGVEHERGDFGWSAEWIFQMLEHRLISCPIPLQFSSGTTHTISLKHARALLCVTTAAQYMQINGARPFHAASAFHPADFLLLSSRHKGGVGSVHLINTTKLFFFISGARGERLSGAG